MKRTAAGNTAFTLLIPPRSANDISHITSILLSTGATAHSIMIMRPQNYTTLTSSAAAAQAVLNIKADPGIFSTNYLYPWPPGAGSAPVPSVADDALATSDYLAYQCADGTWVLDTVSSISTLAITMTTNVPTATALAGTKVFFFGVSTEKDPATNQAAEIIDTTNFASKTDVQLWFESYGHDFAALHPGDPLMLYDGNATNADQFETIAGYYAQY